MDSSRASDLARLEELFHAALERPEAERASFLDATCAGEPELRTRVAALLARHADDVTLTSPLHRGRAAHDADGALLSEGPGSVIGRYELLQLLGEGGFGAVYLARQTAPVTRKVALKIVKLGMDTRAVVARFEAERQALALMEHPGIAKVLDAGATDTGRPYFVMELVRGSPITRFCDERGLDTARRLELFVQVCEAVQHAHQKGVIHRDLKPGNVLVELHDERPVPKVIDFGIAKALTTRLTEKTLFTEQQRFLGTPTYMAPEQAGPSALDVDTRADIYSLGVLLYELLTGSTPFESRRLHDAGLGEVQRILREEEPPRPSTRLGSARDADVARRRASDSESLTRAVRGELDWIVMKALAKERARRYASAGDLAADVRRHLRHEPVEAGPPGARYRLGKFLRRNRVGVGVAALAFVLLVGGIAGTSLGYVEAERNRQRAERNAEEARLSAEQAEQRLAEVLQADARRELLAQYLFDTLALADPSVARDPNLSVKRLLDRAARALPERLADEPVLQSQVHAVLGAAYMSLSQPQLAFDHLTRAERMGAELGALDRYERHELLWRTTDMAFTLERDDAYAYANRALAMGAAYLRERGHAEIADACARFTLTTQDRQGGIAPAERAFDELRALVATGGPFTPREQIILANTYKGGGLATWYSPHEAASTRYYEASLAHMRAVLPANSPAIANTRGLLVGVLNRAGRASEGEAVMRASLAHLREVYPEDSFDVGFARAMLGENLHLQGRHAEAEPELLASHATIAAVVADPHNFYLLDSHSRLVRFYASWGREGHALPHRDALARVAWDYDYPMPWSYARQAFTPEQADLVQPMEQLEQLCDSPFVARRLEPASWPAARAQFDAVLRLAPELVAHDETRRVLVARQLLGWLAAIPADPEWSADVLELLNPWLLPQAERIPLDVAELLALQALLHDARGAREPALEAGRRAARLVLEAPVKDSWFTAASRVRTGQRLARLRLFVEAEQVLLASNATIASQLGEGHHWVDAVRDALATLYERWGRADDAARWR